MLAKENIEKHIKSLLKGDNISTILDNLNFWSNFGLNFKDESFIKLVINNSDVTQKLLEVLEAIDFYLMNFAMSPTVTKMNLFSDRQSRENSVSIEIALKFYDLFKNLTQSKLDIVLTKKMQKSFENFFSNFDKIFKMDLSSYRDSFNEVVGFSYMDNKGNFTYADSQTEYLFNSNELESKNFFQILTEFSKFNIRKKFGENFYDFKKSNCRIREFIFTIDLNMAKSEDSSDIKSENNNSKDDINDKIFDYWNRCKTLIGRITTVLLPIGTEKIRSETQPIAGILLETKLSKYRENFDELVWKELYY